MVGADGKVARATCVAVVEVPSGEDETRNMRFRLKGAVNRLLASNSDVDIRGPSSIPAGNVPMHRMSKTLESGATF